MPKSLLCATAQNEIVGMGTLNPVSPACIMKLRGQFVVPRSDLVIGKDGEFCSQFFVLFFIGNPAEDFLPHGANHDKV